MEEMAKRNYKLEADERRKFERLKTLGEKLSRIADEFSLLEGLRDDEELKLDNMTIAERALWYALMDDEAITAQVLNHFGLWYAVRESIRAKYAEHTAGNAV